MMKRGATGKEVQDFQVMLMRLGYPLPRWGADGGLGGETLAALAMFLRDHKNSSVEDRDDVVSDNELELVRRIHANGPFVGPKVRTLESPTDGATEFHDRRGNCTRAYVYGRRTWKDITGVCMHQTACVMGVKPARYDTLGAHGAITRDGQIMWEHDFLDVVAHGNGWNLKTVGWEGDGLYSGLEDDPKTIPNEALRTTWDSPYTPIRDQPMIPTDELVAGYIAAIEWTIAEVARHGGKIAVLCAHRQASGSRDNDPGVLLWKRVAVPLLEKHKLSYGGPTFKIGSGSPIPTQWDPNATIPY